MDSKTKNTDLENRSLEERIQILEKELKKKEKILTRKAMHYEKIFQKTCQGIVVLEELEPGKLDFVVVSMNTAFEKVTGFTKRQILNKRVKDLKEHISGDLINCILSAISSNTLVISNYYSKTHNKYYEAYIEYLDKNKIAVFVNDISMLRNESRMHKKYLTETVMAMGHMIESKDLYTASHQKQVAILASKIAVYLGLSEEEVEMLYLAGRLHDIGKIGIPAEILTKPDKLSNMEFKLMQEHVTISCHILDQVEYLETISGIVMEHHEKLDGTGYPKGLKGEEISIYGRILAVADVYDAIVSHRPYRSALGSEFAISHLIDNVDTCYDSRIVEACKAVCKEIT